MSTAGGGADDPERAFRRFPRVLKRWTYRAISRRVRMPARRRRWDAENRAATAPYRIGDREGRFPGGGTVCVLGDFSGRTGLSRAGLYELEKLRGAHPGLECHDLGPALHARDPVGRRDGPPVDRLYLLAAPDTYPALLRAMPPDRVRDAWRTGLWVWETPLFPDHWRFAIDLVDEIWTPSEYSRRAIAPAVGAIPVCLRPYPVAPPSPGTDPADAAAMRARLGIAPGTFMGLGIMDIASCPARKNPWAHVAAWSRAFGDDPARVLVLKIRVSKITRVVLGELRAMIGGAGNIRLIEQEMTDAQVAALQGAADVSLSLHRAEGYGLTIHESLAAGTPVIATDFSANAEYGPAFAAYHGLPYRMVPYRDWTGHYAQGGFSWAEVDLDAAVRALRTVAATGEDRARSRGAVVYSDCDGRNDMER